MEKKRTGSCGRSWQAVEEVQEAEHLARSVIGNGGGPPARVNPA